VGECQGTGSVPFQATVEKEPNSTSNQQNSYQSISFQQPYQKWSPEELRLADYAQGRRFGNASGQAGAFGTSTSFGGFGISNTTNAFGGGANTGSNLFGSTNNAPFGQNAQTTSAPFGSNTSSNPFGKPATTTSSGLFGAPTQTTGGTGLFGNTGTTGFGTNTSTPGFGASGGTSIFGANSNQNKPAFNFGTSNTGTSFGTNTGTSTFGSAFGSGTQPQTSSTPFGVPAQPAASNPFGGFGGANTTQTGTGLFGSNNNQAKPGTGLFGATNTSTGTGLFGSNTTSTASNPFGTTLATASNPFAQKPANTGTPSLFGTGNTATNTGSVFGGAFGTLNNQNQQQQNNPSGGLFGNLNTGQQPKPLFGAQTQQNGTIFGNNQQNTSSFFGSLNNTQNQQNQQSSFGTNSLLGSQQAQSSMPQSLTASINDPTAFGTASMFSNLAAPDLSNPGPLATPLSKLSKQKRSPALPMLRMNPASTSRFSTPQRRGFQGFGFSYSTYGTPGSVSSTSSTPLLTMGNSVFGGGLKGLRGSISTSNLRGSYNSTFNPGDSILAPGAFSISPSAKYKTTGSLKALKIDPNFKSDLFQPPSKEPLAANQSSIKKKVSFDASTIGGNGNGNSNGSVNGSASPLKQVQNSATTSPEESGYARSPSRSNGSKSNGIVSPPEMEQVKGNELAIVHEEEAPALAAVSSSAKPISEEDQVPGDYWMKPTKEEILSMNRMQRQKVSSFIIGREGVGEVAFDEPVDLSSINFDELLDNLVVLDIRKVTVYPDASKKPPVGKGLNVPSTIRLMNSWPRGKDKRGQNKLKKHIERLSRVPDTKLLNYDEKQGIWSFKVAHFTTYGVPDEDETDVEGASEFGQSTLSAPPDTPTPKSRTPRITSSDQSFVSSSVTSNRDDSVLEDTFDFKKRILPGAFDNQDTFMEGDGMEDEPEQDEQSFLDDRSVGSQSDIADESLDRDDMFGNQELVRYEDQEMAGSYPQLDRTAELDQISQEDVKKWNGAETSGAILRARMRAMQTSSPAAKRKFKLNDDDWTEMLRRTISPQKQDRAQLKQMTQSEDDRLIEFEGYDIMANSKKRIVSDGRGFANSIDLMHSLFGDANSPVKALKAPSKKGFEVGLPLYI
jgi:nuclear pore complex protein Nup98-Nup96